MKRLKRELCLALAFTVRVRDKGEAERSAFLAQSVCFFFFMIGNHKSLIYSYESFSFSRENRGREHLVPLLGPYLFMNFGEGLVILVLWT